MLRSEYTAEYFRHRVPMLLRYEGDLLEDPLGDSLEASLRDLLLGFGFVVNYSSRLQRRSRQCTWTRQGRR